MKSPIVPYKKPLLTAIQQPKTGLTPAGTTADAAPDKDGPTIDLLTHEKLHELRIGLLAYIERIASIPEFYESDENELMLTVREAVKYGLVPPPFTMGVIQEICAAEPLFAYDGATEDLRYTYINAVKRIIASIDAQLSVMLPPPPLTGR